MNEFILYFIADKNKTKFVYEEQIIEINDNYKKVIEKEFLKELITFDGRKNALKLRGVAEYNVPIIINKDLVFVKINKKNIWVNIFKIKYITKEGYIYFKNGGAVKSDIKYRSLNQRINKIKDMIEDYDKYKL